MREEAKRWKVTPRSGWYDLAAWARPDTPGDLRDHVIDQREMRTHELFFRPGL
jgi:hypothetical protein